MRFTNSNAQLTPAFLALGYCPCQRSGGYYETTVLPVFLSSDRLHLLKTEWFSVSQEFPQAEKWFEKQDKFYFPQGKDESCQWSEMQWQLCASLAEAERKAVKWKNNDLSEEMPGMEFMYSWQAKELAGHIANMKEFGRCQ